MSKQKKDLVPASQNITKDQSYRNLLQDLRCILSDGLKRAEVVVEETDETLEALTAIKDALQNFSGDLHFMDKQVSLKIGQKTHFVDLVLYHEKLNCPVLIRLKDGKFESGDVGLMNTWVNFYRQNLQKKHETDAIGLIICSNANPEEVAYTLNGLEDKIFVLEYWMGLPSKAELQKAFFHY